MAGRSHEVGAAIGQDQASRGRGPGPVDLRGSPQTDGNAAVTFDEDESGPVGTAESRRDIFKPPRHEDEAVGALPR